ncbi:MAG: iron uptake system protein EfeO [Acidimicrobiales bacterium]
MRCTKILLAALPVAVLVAGCSDDGGGGSAATEPVTVTLTDAGCDPTVVSATGGTVTFAVKNDRDSKAEFEILSKTPEILVEKFLESKAAGNFQVNLKAGSYEIICGAPSDTRAALTITGQGDVAVLKVDKAALDAAVTAYTAYVREQTKALETGTKAFTDAVRAGDTEKAKTLYAQVRIPWERIEPVAELFPDSDGVIDSRADDFEQKEADPEFTGFHAIEYGLWANGTIGGAKVDLVSLANGLDKDIAALIALVNGLEIQPQVMTNGAAALIEEAANTKITGEEERYSKTDLATFAANVEGARKVFDLVEVLLSGVNKKLDDSITKDFTTVDDLLAKYKEGAGYASYDKVTNGDRDKFKTSMASLSEDLAQVTGSFGLEVVE